MRDLGVLARIHAWLAFGIGVWWARTDQSGARIASVAAYLACSEVMWRMTGSAQFWEFGKYALATVFLMGAFRLTRARDWVLPGMYFGLLVPSALLTIWHVPLGDARGRISFNLSGPFALATAAMFLARQKFSARQFQMIFLACIGATTSVVTLCLLSTLAGPITFGASSNLEASGGFGPNQVSAVLGFGALACVLFATDPDAKTVLRLGMLGIALVFVSQATLTFSRTGLYLFGICGGVAAIHLMRERRARLLVCAGAAVLYLCLTQLLFPMLDAYTEGALSQRYAKGDLTGRDHIVAADLKIALEHPVLGVGVGMAPEARAEFFKFKGSHTEFTRLFAEHGLTGFLALVVLFALSWKAYFTHRESRSKAMSASLLAFSYLFMCVSGMRLALPSLAFGLAFATLLRKQNKRVLPEMTLRMRQRARGLNFPTATISAP